MNVRKPHGDAGRCFDHTAAERHSVRLFAETGAYRSTECKHGPDHAVIGTRGARSESLGAFGTWKAHFVNRPANDCRWRGREQIVTGVSVKVIV
jgi:hypothetical protein